MNLQVPRGFAAFMAFIVAQRTFELIVSARNRRRALAGGAREYGAEHFPMLVAVHALFIVGLAGEVLFLGARPGPLWPLWLLLWAAAQVLRYAAMRALGDRWNVRILVFPGKARVTTGPYRFLNHPNYVAVIVELACAPLVFGAWRTALVVSAINAHALRTRIRAENAALLAAERG